ncbi:MAG TPA: ABC-2 family transporter protein [Frankiaceae bacterium]|jgi:ABC-2 type transport system permease protein|nr:ABC-2 family transporter protein [Frankiaceae bacterium]
MRALLVTMRGALAEAWANRGAFWVQVATMVVNDIAWVAFWVLFFHRVGTLRGWDGDRVLLLLAVLTSSAGLVLGLFANARSLGRLVNGGEIDAALTLPVPTLPYLLVRRVNSTNLGDVLFGFVLFVVAGSPTPSRVGIYLVGVATSAVLLTGFLVATGSIALFAGRDDVGELSFHGVLLLSSYPVDVFGPIAKVVMYTVVPAAFLGAVPAKLMDSFDPVVAATMLGAAAFFALLGWVTFNAGLRRYTSGAVWTNA